MYKSVQAITIFLQNALSILLFFLIGIYYFAISTDPVFANDLKKYSSKILDNQPGRKKSGLTITWFGAASILIDDGSGALLIDPFVSRKNNTPVDILFRRDAEIDWLRVLKRSTKPNFARTKAILVSHSHYDHVLDVPAFSKFLEAPIYGSMSTNRIVEAHPASWSKIIKPKSKLNIKTKRGGFNITVFPGKHGKPPLPIDPLKSEVTSSFALPTSINAYGLGEIYTYFIQHKFGSILHIGSAGIPEKTFHNFGHDIDVVLLSLVGRRNTQSYLNEIVKELNPRYVIPIHYDNLFRSIEEDLKIIRQAKIDEYFSSMAKLFPDVSTGLIQFDKPWQLPSE